MRPPICELCGSDFRREDLGSPVSGSLVYFRETEADAAQRMRMQNTGMVGHPGNAGWFCAAHIRAAEALADRTLSGAMRELRSQFPS